MDEVDTKKILLEIKKKKKKTKDRILQEQKQPKIIS